MESFRVSTHMSTLSKPIITMIILIALYYFVYGGEGSIASCSMTKMPESQILEKLCKCQYNVHLLKSLELRNSLLLTKAIHDIP